MKRRLALLVLMLGLILPAVGQYPRTLTKGEVEAQKQCGCPCHTKHWLENGQEVTHHLNFNGKKFPTGPCNCSTECSAKAKCARPKGTDDLSAAQQVRVGCACERFRQFMETRKCKAYVQDAENGPVRCVN